MQLSRQAGTQGGRGGGTDALVVRGVSHAYGARKALDGVGFSVSRGSFTALLGPNGAGKTTLFGLVTRLIGLRTGTIEICGLNLAGARAKALAPLGLVFQQPTLDLDLTVRQNLFYFAALRNMSRATAQKRIIEELTRLDMAERVDERVRNLNGGHRRRVELARALLHDPALLLLDEPTVGLDVESRRRIVAHVHDLAEERGLGVLWATHLIDEVLPHDDLVVLNRGRVVASGKAVEVAREVGEDDLDGAFARLTAPEAGGTAESGRAGAAEAWRA
ncbi:ATP-binding cassette domain-containing protein [Lutibaculum baratangense]|uniref:ATP-binding cassette domain-containing protein n=1 Tax=Lutibaculum baratangense TaxID=1358440 RepID=UPI000688C3F8|nr:ATP-binding cassette domain-containing protein [Lutibaculum baratangense]